MIQTPAQMIAARRSLGWSRDRLAAESGVTIRFIVRYERDGRVATMFTRDREFDGLAAVRDCLEAAQAVQQSSARTIAVSALDSLGLAIGRR